MQVTARSAADVLGLQANTAALFYHKLRLIIAGRLAEESGLFGGEVEVDESYFGGVRKGKRGRGALGKVPVFGLLKRGGKVYAVTIPDSSTRTLMPIIADKVHPDSIVYTDSYRSYNALDVTTFTHRRVNHSREFVTRRGHHINGIENFWNQAKRWLRRYNGIPEKHFNLFLQECVFRFNFGSPRNQVNTLRSWLNL
jgi:transposase